MSNLDIAGRMSALTPQKRALLEKLLKKQGVDPHEIPLVRRARPGRVAPMSFPQQRLWFFDQFDPKNPVYNGPMYYRIRGRLDLRAFVRALKEMVRRHEVLRTHFGMVGESPVQFIQDAIEFEVPVEDLSDLPEPEREPAALRRALEERAHPFDLSRGPLIRCVLLRLRNEEHIVLLTLHHIIFDGWSTGVLWTELGALYEALVNGKEPALPELPIQYADYAEWQQDWFRGAVLEQHFHYWRERLRGGSPLELPTDRPRPPVQTFRGGSHEGRLTRDITAKLYALGSEEGASSFMILLALFKLLLSRLSGQKDVAIGSPIAGRQRRETERLIGFFVNTLVFRTELRGDESFRQLLRRVREGVLGAFDHQDLPFEKVVSELQPARDLSRTPLFQVMFNAMNFRNRRPGLAGAEVDFFSVEKGDLGLDGSAKFDVTLYALEGSQSTQLVAAYNADLFDHRRVVEMLDQLSHLAGQVTEGPDRRISDYDLVTEAALRTLPEPARWVSVREEGGVLDGFRRQVARVPGNAAVIGEGAAWTYADLEHLSNQLAHRLLQGGIGRGDVVAVWARRSAALVWALVGILKAGGRFLILDPAYPASRLRQCVCQAQVRGWVECETVPESFLADPGLSGIRVRVEDGLSLGTEGVEGGASTDPGMAGGPDDPAYIAFTSGTTGAPRGILGNQRPLSHFLGWHIQRFGLAETDRFCLLSGLSHDPLLRDIFTPLWLGATICVPAKEDLSPSRLAGWMSRERITVAHLTPAMGEVLLAGAMEASVNSPERPPLGDLRYVFFGGDTLNYELLRRLRRSAPTVACVNFYGATETPQAMGYYVVPEAALVAEGSDRAGGAVPIGRGIDDVDLLVLSDGQRLAGIGELGEIYVHTPYLTVGYLGDEDLTHQKYVVNPLQPSSPVRLYRTGDLGRYLPDGNVVFAGRVDHQVKIRGFRVELEEVEAVLMRHPCVRQAAVAVSDEGTDRSLIAYLVGSGESRPDRAEIRRFMLETLPDYMIPQVCMWLAALPLTPSGKVNYRALPAPGPSVPGMERGYVEPATELETGIAGIWREVLHLEKVGVQDNFFDLGGHSLLVLKVHRLMIERLGRDLSLVDIFKHPTIRSLARHLCEVETETGVVSPVSVSERVDLQADARARRQQRMQAVRRQVVGAGSPGA